MTDIEDDVPLAPLTTLGVGGPARHYVACRSVDDVCEALAFARDRGLGVLALGGGSNMLVSDRGFDGLVIRMALRGVSRRDEGDAVVVDAQAGEPWDDFVEHAVRAGLAGLECLSGIPGDVGSTPIQNVGAYGQEVADTIRHVDLVDRTTLERTRLDASSCRFAYRDSAFKRELRGRYLITSVGFTLRAGPPTVVYPELVRALSDHAAPSLVDVRRTVLRLRRAKSMVIDPEDENRRSAGSFFTNPILDDAAAECVRARVDLEGVLREGESMPSFHAGEGRTKLSAAWLIERAGFAKGTQRGPVGISTKHSLALVNRGGATARAIVDFAREVRDTVEQRFGVRLVPEPELVGFDRTELGDLLG
jgi:UDP-N-acetylmuramate dehydrogenase